MNETNNPSDPGCQGNVFMLCLFCIDPGFCNTQLNGDTLWVPLRQDYMGSNSYCIVKANYYIQEVFDLCFLNKTIIN